MWHEKHSGLYNLAAVIMVVTNFRWEGRRPSHPGTTVVYGVRRDHVMCDHDVCVAELGLYPLALPSTALSRLVPGSDCHG